MTSAFQSIESSFFLLFFINSKDWMAITYEADFSTNFMEFNQANNLKSINVWKSLWFSFK